MERFEFFIKRAIMNSERHKSTPFRRNAMASLYLTIKLQGLGWKNGPSEEDYATLVKIIREVIRGDSRFVNGRTLKTVSIQIRGYDPTVKELLIRHDGFSGFLVPCPTAMCDGDLVELPEPPHSRCGTEPHFWCPKCYSIFFKHGSSFERCDLLPRAIYRASHVFEIVRP